MRCNVRLKTLKVTIKNVVADRDIGDYSTSELLAELEHRKTRKVAKVRKRSAYLFSSERDGAAWRCETCETVLDMPSSREWHADNHFQHGALWHYPCYRAIEKLGHHVTYAGALISVKTGARHFIN